MPPTAVLLPSSTALVASLVVIAACCCSTVSTATCDTPVNVTLDSQAFGELVSRIQTKIYEVTAPDTEGRRYYPFVAGFVRLAFHVCAARRCSSFLDVDDPANRGLLQVVSVLNDLWQSLQREDRWRGFSKADLYAAAGVAALEVATDRRRSVAFRYGRADHCAGEDAGAGGLGVRLPARGVGTQQTFAYFARTFGFDERETVAILGAHSLGAVHAFSSSAPPVPIARWTNSDPGKLSNDYYKQMLVGPWQSVRVNQSHAPSVAAWEWHRPSAGGRDEANGARLMLNCDMGLVKTVSVRNSVTGAAACTDYAACAESKAAAAVRLYASDPELFLNDFANAFGKMLENGWAGQLKDVSA